MTEEQIIFSSKNLRIGERIDVATTGRISDLFRDIRLNNKGYGDHFGTIRDPLKPLTLKWIYDYVKFLRSMATQLENIADEAGGRTEQVRDEWVHPQQSPDLQLVQPVHSRDPADWHCASSPCIGAYRPRGTQAAR